MGNIQQGLGQDGEDFDMFLPYDAGNSAFVDCEAVFLDLGTCEATHGCVLSAYSGAVGTVCSSGCVNIADAAEYANSVGCFAVDGHPATNCGTTQNAPDGSF